MLFYVKKYKKIPKPLLLPPLLTSSSSPTTPPTTRTTTTTTLTTSRCRSSSNNSNSNNILFIAAIFIVGVAASLCRLVPAAAGHAVGGDAPNGNLTDLGSPALGYSKQLIPHGSQQIYDLVNKVTMTDLQQGDQQETSYTFHTQLKVNSVWNTQQEQLLQVYFSDAMVSAPNSNKLVTQQHISKISDRPFYISLTDGGKPSKVIAHTSRDQSLLNLERGIASLLQLRYENGPVSELDVSGQCNAFYAIKSSTRIEKTKTDCSHWDLKVNYRVEKPLSVAQHSQERVEFDLSAAGLLLKAESQETHRVALESKPDVGSQVASQLLLKHVTEGREPVEQLKFSTLETAIESLMDWYRVFDIEADVDGTLSEIKQTTLKKEIARHAAMLSDEHIGRETLAVLFAELLPVARITKAAAFVDILQAHRELHSQLVDLLGAVQTIDAHKAIHEVFQYNKSSDAELLEKYLQSLGVGTHPERAIVEHLFQQLTEKQPIENEKLRDTVIQTVAALSRQSGFDPNDPLLAVVRSYLQQQLAFICKDIACKTLYIRALQNLQDSSTIPLLLTHVTDSVDPQLSVAAMQALQSLPIINFREEHRRIFTDIFYQRRRKYDSSVRTLALDILLVLKPTKQQLGDLIDYLSSADRHFEVKTYVIQKLRMLAEKCPRFRALLGACLLERPKINNYHVIAQKGLTTVLTRQLSQTPAFNESLLSVQEIYQGVLKRGSVELILAAGREETSTFKLGIYTSGLSSFVSDGDDSEVDDEDADDSPATAGMEISVQGILLRPLIFFTGQTELMGHVWSGTASEPTPAYQATTLTQDHEHYVVLASGATIYVRVLGAKSIDLKGKVELSIWNRNANTEIHQNSGDAVVGHMIAGFTYAKVQNKFTLANEPKISLQADIDFYSGVKLCMQLQRPEMTMTHSNTRSVTLSAATKPYTKLVRSKYSHKSPGRTLALNQKNNEMCNMIFSS